MRIVPASMPSFTRSAFYVMDALFNKNVIGAIHENRKILTNGLVALSMDEQKGIIQHKQILLRSMLTHQFPGEEVYSNFAENYKIATLVYPINVSTDARVFSEFPTLFKYYENFNESKEIKSTRANLDKFETIMDGAKQRYLDFTVWVKAKWDGLNFFGYNTKLTIEDGILYKQFHHDDKSAGGMLAHATSGTLGVLTYNTEKNNIPVTTLPISYDALINIDLNNIKNIRAALNYDINPASTMFEKKLLIAEAILKDKTIPNYERHTQYQKYLWKELQLHPAYNRSLSFIFTNEVGYNPLTDKALDFELRFRMYLNKSELDLSKLADRRLVFAAMLRAYKETSNPNLKVDIEYLSQKIGVKLSTEFLQLFAHLIKRESWMQQ